MRLGLGLTLSFFLLFLFLFGMPDRHSDKVVGDDEAGVFTLPAHVFVMLVAGGIVSFLGKCHSPEDAEDGEGAELDYNTCGKNESQ